MRTILLAAGVLGLLTGSAALQSRAQETATLQPMTVDGRFIGEEAGQRATDISGIACMPPLAGRRLCLAINDQNRNAQFATIENDRLVVGPSLPLFGDEPKPKPLGKPPGFVFEESEKYKDLDGEAVAYANSAFYVLGSHGRGRGGGKLHPSSFLLARVRVDADGRPAETIEMTWRVSDLLAHEPRVRAFVGKTLETENGLNIEGIAVQGDTVWLGLRAPVVPEDETGEAFLLRGSLSDLFRDGAEPAQSFHDAIALKLEGRGIRDLATLPDGRLLALAGAPSGPEVPFKLFVVDTATKTARPVATLPPVRQQVGEVRKTGKAEAVTVLEAAPDAASLVVLFDGLLDGLPHTLDVRLPH